MGSTEALGVNVSRMTAAIVVFYLWAELRQVCIALSGAARKLAVLLDKHKLNVSRSCMNDTTGS